MHRLYFYAYKFFCGMPRPTEAGMLARAFLPLFVLVNIQLPVYCVSAVLGTKIEVPWSKSTLVVAYTLGWAVCTWWFKGLERGDEVVERLSRTIPDRESRLVGAILVFETLFGIFVPAAIAVIRNPTPWIN